MAPVPSPDRPILLGQPVRKTHGSSNLTATYHTTDLVRSITAGGRTTTYTLDVNTERVRTWTDYDGTTTTTKKHHYDADTDNPAWTDEGAARYTRTIASIAGDLSATYDSTPGAVTFQLANLHGDLIATTAPNLTTQPGLLTTNDPTEHGLQRNPTTAGTTRYGWLGAEQRATDTPTGITLMGVRLYNPATGRFLTVDPVNGGSCNDYDYTCADPANGSDLDGKRLAYDRGAGRYCGRVNCLSTLNRTPQVGIVFPFPGAGIRYAAGTKSKSLQNKKKTYSGARYSSRRAARRAAKRDVDRYSGGGYCKFRGACKSDTHYHVDYYNVQNRVVHTRHYYYRGGRWTYRRSGGGRF